MGGHVSWPTRVLPFPATMIRHVEGGWGFTPIEPSDGAFHWNDYDKILETKGDVLFMACGAGLTRDLINANANPLSLTGQKYYIHTSPGTNDEFHMNYDNGPPIASLHFYQWLYNLTELHQEPVRADNFRAFKETRFLAPLLMSSHDYYDTVQEKYRRFKGWGHLEDVPMEDWHTLLNRFSN